MWLKNLQYATGSQQVKDYYKLYKSQITIPENMNPLLQKGESITVSGLHIATNKLVDIKFISKIDLNVPEIELLRD